MRPLLILCLLTTSYLSAQQIASVGCLKADPEFCKTKDSDSESICNSKVPIEIRLAIRHIEKLSIDYSQIILTFQSSGWKAIKKTYTFQEIQANPYKAAFVIDKIIPLIATNGFDRLFENLKSNDIFCLPNQSEIIADTVMNGGTFYNLTFKVGESFRTYFFFNPDKYVKQSPRDEFLKYNGIADIFQNQLTSE